MAETLATLHHECLFEDQPLGWTLRGREGARQHYDFWWSTFDVHLDAGQLHWARADLAIGEAVFAGRHVGDFFGRSATGLRISLPFVVVVSFRDGLLSGERFTYDLASLLRQLGYDVLDPAAARAASATSPPPEAGGRPPEAWNSARSSRCFWSRRSPALESRKKSKGTIWP
jgi:SnoaL-like polyketide cyclase